MIKVRSRSEYLSDGQKVRGEWEIFDLSPETLTPLTPGSGDNGLPLKHLREGFSLQWRGRFNAHQTFPRVEVISNPDYVLFEYPSYPPRSVSFDEFTLRRQGE